MMGERLAFIFLIHLLIYLSLWLWWFCRPFPLERPRRASLGRMLMLLGAAVFVAMLIAGTVGWFLHPWEMGGCGCMGGGGYPPFDAPAFWLRP